MISEKNFKKDEEMLKESLIAMKIATNARKSAGIIFPSDNNY